MGLENITSKLSAEDFESLQHLLDACNTLVLATVDFNGHPYSTPLYYCSDDELNLYFYSSKESYHSGHLLDEKNVSVGIFNEHDSINALKGLQIKGCATKIKEKFKNEAKELYLSKFEPIIKREFIELEIASKNCYKICPSWIKMVDNSVKFGFKQEWECE